MRIIKLASVFAVLVALSMGTAATAAPNIFGITGTLEMPNDVVLAPGQVSLGYFRGFDVIGNDDANFFTGVIGVATGLEIGVGFADPEDADSATLLNAKYRLLAETVDRPALTIGVVDVAEDLDLEDDDPSFFFLVSKTLTEFAEDVTDAESKPLRGHIGFGTGVYQGLIAALNWQLSPKFQASFEYLNEGIGSDTEFNGLIRYALTNELRLDAGMIDFDDLVLGISYTSMRF